MKQVKKIKVLGIREYEKGGINFKAKMLGQLILDNNELKLVIFRAETFGHFIEWLQNLRDGKNDNRNS